jgi:hypothetical protein
VAVDAEGDYVVAWISYEQDGSQSGIFACRFASNGTPLAAEFQVNAHTVIAQNDPALGLGEDGQFVVAWQSNSQDGPEYGIFARRFTSAGAPQGLDFQVNTRTAIYQSFPAVGSAAAGAFVVA